MSTANNFLNGDAPPPAADPAGAADPSAAGTAPGAAPAPAPDGAAPGSAGLQVPGKDATPDQWAEFYKQIGAPDKAEAYELPLPEGDKGEFAGVAKNWFKDAGLLPQQAKALAEKWNGYQAELAAKAQAEEATRMAAQEASAKQQEQQLRGEWGQQFDGNVELARRAIRQFVPKEQAADVVEALESKLGFAGVIKLFHGVGRGLGEHDQGGLPGVSSPAGKRDIASILYGGSNK